MKRLALASALLASCAHAEPIPLAPLALPGTLLSLEAEAGEDAGELPRLAPLALEALGPLERWGGLKFPTRIVVLPNHEALETRTKHSGFGWLRAWARFDVVYLQSPRSWGFGASPSLPELRDLLTHELAHCAMYQELSDGSDWAHKEIPLWFREGFASWTSKQGGKRLTPEALALTLRARRDLDPLGNAEALYRADEPVVYAAAHWAFAALEQLGDDKILALLATVRRGWSFPVAFAQVYGEDSATFEARTLTALREPGSPSPETTP